MLGEEQITSVVYVRDIGSGRRWNVTGPRRLRDVWMGTGWSPSWLPDGRELAFGFFGPGGGYVGLVGDRGQRRRILWRTDGSPLVDWSPDGKNAAVGVRADPGLFTLWIYDTQTGARRQVDQTTESARWSPDMRRYIHYRQGIVVTDEAGRELRRLTSNRMDTAAAWSPDGRSVVYERDGDLYVAAVDGGTPRRLVATASVHESLPAWQPRRAGDVLPRSLFRTPCTLLGTRRSETLRGTPGSDFAEARRGDDRVLLGDGHDIGRGGAGTDALFGGRGNDILDGGDGRDRIDCGPGRDLVHADRRDVVARDCERRAPPPD